METNKQKSVKPNTKSEEKADCQCPDDKNGKTTENYGKNKTSKNYGTFQVVRKTRQSAGAPKETRYWGYIRVVKGVDFKRPLSKGVFRTKTI